MKTRRQFCSMAGTGLLATGASTFYPLSGISSYFKEEDLAFTIGMAGYTFREFTIDETIMMMKRTGVDTISLKDFHMPLDSTREEIESIINRFSGSGISVYAVGVVYMRSREAVDQAFEYAKMAGVKMIVGAPDYDLLPYVEEKVKSYDIKVAIHNHGPDNPLFPNATDIWNHIIDLDPRVGICIDIGHTARDGEDPSLDIERYSERIYDIHIKDVDKPSKEGRTVEMGRGIIDIPQVVNSIRKIKYTGRCSLEFEKDMNDPLPGIAESIGYFRGVLVCSI